jgi:hypothetical protein
MLSRRREARGSRGGRSRGLSARSVGRNRQCRLVERDVRGRSPTKRVQGGGLRRARQPLGSRLTTGFRRGQAVAPATGCRLRIHRTLNQVLFVGSVRIALFAAAPAAGAQSGLLLLWELPPLQPSAAVTSPSRIPSPSSRWSTSRTFLEDSIPPEISCSR